MEDVRNGIAVAAEKIEQATHPFYPIGLDVAGYFANKRSVPVLLGIFFSGCFGIMVVTWVSLSRFSPRLRRNDKLAIVWLILSGIIHLFFEGYFSVNHTRMASAQDLLGEWWKEYAMSDSRYLTSDAFVLCMESVTAFLWGPLSFYTVYLIACNHPLRHPMQAIVTLGEIYGLVLYYATGLFDHYYKDVTYCRPEAFYFWFYFFFMNFIWMVIPGALLWQSVITTSQAFSALDKMSNTVPAKRATNKAGTNGHIKEI